MSELEQGTSTKTPRELVRPFLEAGENLLWIGTSPQGFRVGSAGAPSVRFAAAFGLTAVVWFVLVVRYSPPLALFALLPLAIRFLLLALSILD